LPEWFSEVVFSGGSGLISPGETSVTTLKIEPGYYVVECYVKMANGIFHSAMGMVKELIVTEDSTTFVPELPDIAVTISGIEGIRITGKPVSGQQVFSVYFKNQEVYEHFVGHDINLVRLDENANLEALDQWMNWTRQNGLKTPSPEGVTFLGGINDSPAGNTGYFKANLFPGNYALIAEVPNASKKNMFRTFKVTE
jgi:hypothetical protein